MCSTVRGRGGEVKNKQKYHSSFSIFIFVSLPFFYNYLPYCFFPDHLPFLYRFSFGGGKRKDNVQIGLVNDCDCMCVSV